MSALRLTATMAALGLLAFGAMAAPVSAADVGCGGPTVEVCIPVCVTEPCTRYVCVHARIADACVNV